MTTQHPDYAVLAARIAISNLHKETKKTFSHVIRDLYEYGASQLPLPPFSAYFLCALECSYSQSLNFFLPSLALVAVDSHLIHTMSSQPKEQQEVTYDFTVMLRGCHGQRRETQLRHHLRSGFQLRTAFSLTSVLMKAAYHNIVAHTELLWLQDLGALLPPPHQW